MWEFLKVKMEIISSLSVRTKLFKICKKAFLSHQNVNNYINIFIKIEEEKVLIYSTN